MQNQPGHAETQWTILKLLQWTSSYFESQHVESPRASAEILLAHGLNLRRIDLYLRYDQPLSAAELTHYKALIKKRLNREPVAYITGAAEFWSLPLSVTRDVLIPRPETECLVEAVQKFLAAETAPAPRRILELGTGSGAIVLALASLFPQHRYYASDREPRAVEVARRNARRHAFDGRICFFAGDWLDPVKPAAGFDVIVSNPPYIRSDLIDRLQPEIARYEPRRALDGGRDGFKCIDRIVGAAHRFLKKGGRLYLEIGHDQRAELLQRLTVDGRYRAVRFSRDYSGHDRVVEIEQTDGP